MKLIANCTRHYDNNNQMFYIENSEDLLTLVTEYDEVFLYKRQWECVAVIRKFKRLNQNARFPQDDDYYYVAETVVSISPTVYHNAQWVAGYVYGMLEWEEKIAKEVEATLATEGEENA